jgi:hypothetical protein
MTPSNSVPFTLSAFLLTLFLGAGICAAQNAGTPDKPAPRNGGGDIVRLTTALLAMDGVGPAHRFEAYTHRAKAHFENGESQKAFDDLAAALKLPGIAPDKRAAAQAQMHAFRGDLHMNAKKWAAAAASFTKALDTPGLAARDETKMVFLFKRAVASLHLGASGKRSHQIDGMADLFEIAKFPDGETKRDMMPMVKAVLTQLGFPDAMADVLLVQAAKPGADTRILASSLIKVFNQRGAASASRSAQPVQWGKLLRGIGIAVGIAVGIIAVVIAVYLLVGWRRASVIRVEGNRLAVRKKTEISEWTEAFVRALEGESSKTTDEFLDFLAGDGAFWKSLDVEKRNHGHPSALDRARLADGFSHALRWRVLLFCKPDARRADDCLRLLGFDAADDSKKSEAARHDDETLQGWAAAALGRCACEGLTPEAFAGALEETTALMQARNKDIEKFNATLLEYNALKDIAEYNALPVPSRKSRSLSGNLGLPEGLDGILRNRNKVALASTLETLKAKLDAGVTGYFAGAGCNPAGLLLFMLGDSQGRYGAFAQQGAIMGLLGFLEKHKAHPAVAPHHASVLAKRESLVAADGGMSFFEVRAPRDCGPEEYGILLRLVLQSANAATDYCDTKVLMRHAAEEIPGVMRLLQKHPLRLIDSRNTALGGFFAFRPFQHLLVTNYSGAKDKGPVHRRHNHVGDMTTPLATGLNLSLFTGALAALPVLFHEHEHFLGDRNEASVFLKTQLFSLALYKKYPDAGAARDTTFTLLVPLLGVPPSAKRHEALNNFVEKLYGRKMTREEAAKAAAADINNINVWIAAENKAQTWHPEVPYPLLTEAEDAENTAGLREILIRYKTTPRTITLREFKAILAKNMTRRQSP